ncbi:MAG TPA: AAA family ATPase [Bryobacteraceae bacterium]|nr:AAA family ATPase [Bryobacteraceae bacterium]
MAELRLTRIAINGYRCFREFSAELAPLTVIVGANGSGKSSLFEFITFLKAGAEGPLPPEIVPGTAGMQIFHDAESPALDWELAFTHDNGSLIYRGQLLGPRGSVSIPSEELRLEAPGVRQPVLSVDGVRGTFSDKPLSTREGTLNRPRANQLVISSELAAESAGTAGSLRMFLLSSDVFLSAPTARGLARPVSIEQDAVLDPRFTNLAAVLLLIQTEFPAAFDSIQRDLSLLIPGLKRATVKPRGGPGEAMAYLTIGRIESSLGDLSDGQLRMLCWVTLCNLPTPAPLICIDEPDQGIHPRALAILAAMFRRASGRSQFVITTHNSYFLKQFDYRNEIAVMRLEAGRSVFVRTRDSAALVANLEEFGSDEIERMHHTQELDALA